MKRYFYFILLVSGIATAQKDETYAIEASVLRGNILPHTEDMHQLINGHPQAVMLNFTAKTYGRKEWQRAYNFPDYGAYFLYQDFNSHPLGTCYSAGAFYNFYFLKRHLQLKLTQGLAYATNPYDKEDNSKNKAFGTPFLDNTNIGLNYDNQTLFKNIGFHAKLGNIVPFLIFWYLLVIVLNIVSIVFLVKYKPRFYGFLIFLGTAIIAFPLAFLYMLSQIKMC
jgi:hypothetical protein